MTNTSPNQTETKPKKKHSLFYRLNNPRFGSAIDPLFESWRMFVHIVADVFAVYKLIPMDYPGRDNLKADLSLFRVFKDAWKSVAFTKESALKTLLFFAVVGIVFGGAIAAIIALFSMFVGTAHAQTAGIFDPESNDAAAAWLEFLFNDGPLPTFENSGTSTGTPAFNIQGALKAALAFYSNAILIIAALILFYHFASMIAETAHTGVVMGKRANQVWAPIRLVVAIGLLVPISGGLSAGQYIVIKTAQLGSGLATQTWNIFLKEMISPSTAVISGAGMVYETTATLISNLACVIDYNARVDAIAARDGSNLDKIRIPLDGGYLPPGQPATVNNQRGTRYSFGHKYPAPSDAYAETCGWLFLPDPGTGVAGAAAAAQRSALMSSLPAMYTAASEILKLVPEEDGGKDTDVAMNGALMFEALNVYTTNLQSAANAFSQNSTVSSSMEQIKEGIQQYGWAFAGTFFPTIERMQAVVSDAFEGAAPVQKIGPYEQPIGLNIFSATEQKTKVKAYEDMRTYAEKVGEIWAQGSGQSNIADAQCTAMWGLVQETKAGLGLTDSAIDGALVLIDAAGSLNGVWQYGDNGKCANGLSRFKLGTQLTDGTDVLQQLVALGHSEVNMGLRLIVWGIVTMAGSGLIGALLTLVSGPLGMIVGAIGVAGGILMETAAFIFISMGFIFAFILPMIVFTRFFFAVIIWIGEVIESVIAIPLIALAHLNPEGEGLAGAKARNAYFMIFSNFLRPVLSVFGLIGGLLVFMIAANFLNYAYGIAVAATGGTSYLHAILAKIVFTILYTYLMYVCANQSFAFIDDLPKGAMEWMNEKGSPVPNLGRYEQMQQYEQIAGTIVTKEGISGITRATKSITDAGTKATQGKVAEMKKEGPGDGEVGAG